jgi:hypothetical protein
LSALCSLHREHWVFVFVVLILVRSQTSERQYKNTPVEVNAVLTVSRYMMHDYAVLYSLYVLPKEVKKNQKHQWSNNKCMHVCLLALSTLSRIKIQRSIESRVWYQLAARYDKKNSSKAWIMERCTCTWACTHIFTLPF